jgi:hypothetical protein
MCCPAGTTTSRKPRRAGVSPGRARRLGTCCVMAKRPVLPCYALTTPAGGVVVAADRRMVLRGVAEPQRGRAGVPGEGGSHHRACYGREVSTAGMACATAYGIAHAMAGAGVLDPSQSAVSVWGVSCCRCERARRGAGRWCEGISGVRAARGVVLSTRHIYTQHNWYVSVSEHAMAALPHSRNLCAKQRL